MSTIRVALIVNALGTGGVERQMLALAAGLDRSRFDVELISLKSGGSLRDQVARLGLKGWSAEARPGIDWRAVRRLAAHLQTSGFDVVMAANQYATMLTRLAVAMGRKPGMLLSAFHSSPSHVGDRWKARTQLFLYRLALRRFDGIVYVSSQQRDEWNALGLRPGLASAVIHNGIDVDRFAALPARDVRSELGWGRDTFVVGLCAALREEKRPVDLLKAAHELLRQGVPIKLLIIGDGPQRASIEAAAKDFQLREHLHVTGLQGDVAPFIHACDVMTLVSSAEAFSIAVLEAMACGKPLVLTEVGGAAEQIENGVHGYRVPVGEPASVAARLAQIWRDGSAAHLGANGKARVRAEFSTQHMLDEYSRLFSSGQGTQTRPAQAPRASSIAQR